MEYGNKDVITPVELVNISFEIITNDFKPTETL